MNKCVLYCLRFSVLLGYLAGQFGIPIPPIRTAISTEDFPCQGHQCGCMSAEQCRTSCCCVLKPKSVTRRSKQVTTAAAVSKTELSSSFNRHFAKDCCSSKKETESQQQEDSAGSSYGWMFAFQAMKCRGNSAHWLTVSELAVVVHFDNGCPADDRVIGTVDWTDESFRNSSTRPLVPPG
jgi:hypothetical protein